jgi:hypothetical protein
VLKRATEDRPERRYQTVREFWEELSDASLPPTQPLRPQDGEGERERPVSKQLRGTDEAVGEAPPRPRFDSRDAIKQSQMRGNGSARPRIVVPVAGAQPYARVSAPLPPQPAARHPTRATAPPIPAHTRRADDPNDFTPAEEAEARRRWLRALVALLIIVMFAGVLLATHFYVSRRRAQQQQQQGTTVGNTFAPEVGREGVIRQNTFLRRDPDMSSNPPIRTVQRGARVRILSVSDNNRWYQVEVLSEEGAEPDAVKRGWMGKSTIDVD